VLETSPILNNLYLLISAKWLGNVKQFEEWHRGCSDISVMKLI